MKKFIVVLLLLFGFNVVNASVNTYERSESDYRVHSSIIINNNNISNILSTPSVNESEKVYDFADLLSESEESLLYNEVIKYINDFNMDMVILTISDNPKGSAKEYAEDFYDYNYFGIGNTFDGILFIIDMDTREMYILTTGSAIIMYDDERIDNILDSSYAYISREDYYNTCNSFIKKSHNYALSGKPDSNKNLYIDKDGNIDNEISYGGCFAISAGISLIIILIMVNMNKLVVSKVNVHNNLVSDSLKIEKVGQTLVNTYTTSTRIASSSSSSFGSSSRSGGSSISRGSSGRSHGGGGRRF